MPYFYISMEYLGQQVVAEEAMDIAAKEGHWVVLQNIHLGLGLCY